MMNSSGMSSVPSGSCRGSPITLSQFILSFFFLLSDHPFSLASSCSALLVSLTSRGVRLLFRAQVWAHWLVRLPSAVTLWPVQQRHGCMLLCGPTAGKEKKRKVKIRKQNIYLPMAMLPSLPSIDKISFLLISQTFSFAHIFFKFSLFSLQPSDAAITRVDLLPA